MEETLKMMKSILTGKEGKVDEKELIKEYQEKLSPNILAYFYSNNFGLIYNLSKKYSNLLDEDKASFCLQELDKCLQNFSLDRNIKFITYFLTCYTYRLNNLYYTKNYTYDKFNTVELEKVNCSYDIDTFTDENGILNQYNLTQREKLQCKLLNIGYSFKEISTILKVSESAVSQKNAIIKQKILNTYLSF